MDQTLEIFKSIEEMQTDLKWIERSVQNLHSKIDSLVSEIEKHKDEISKMKERETFRSKVVSIIIRYGAGSIIAGGLIDLLAHMTKLK